MNKPFAFAGLLCAILAIFAFPVLLYAREHGVEGVNILPGILLLVLLLLAGGFFLSNTKPLN